ncbi:hypothetical protein BCON_0025g00060 [Botryotinia convoluta]|uniref:Uncharacterized protein n=1 Tax=Botryotinia convoluta TaxID=54673 RepID=A0A4Z1IME2_9HELO|nr:hypothetical protein BCON_0025g00060 [Botryotinia convoluta]
MTGEAAGTSFEGILYEQWSEYLTKLQEMQKSLSEWMEIESMGGNRDTNADRERFAEGKPKDKEATVVERLENICYLVGCTARNPTDMEME